MKEFGAKFIIAYALFMNENQNNYLPEPDSFTVDNNKLQLVHTAAARMKAVLALVEEAQKSLKIFYYMVEPDNVGTMFRDALVEAAKRGVSVELMVDSFGSNKLPPEFFNPLTVAGGKFAVFSPRYSTSYFVRNHQKMMIADNRRALIGGFNIANQYFDQHSADENSEHNETSWEDMGLLIDGPEIENLTEYYGILSRWVRDNNGNMRSLRKVVRQWESGNGKFQWLLGGPSNRLSRWARSIKQDFEKGERLDLVSAYFSPGQGLLRRIGKISKNGGESRIILPGKTDNAATIGASRLLYGYLLKRKAQIYEYEPKRLHMKLVIVDNAVYIGSANFDLRSLFINVEMMLRIEDAGFADHVRGFIEELANNSVPITTELHKSRKTFLSRLRWTISYFVVNTLDYTVNRRLNFGVNK